MIASCVPKSHAVLCLCRCANYQWTNTPRPALVLKPSISFYFFLYWKILEDLQPHLDEVLLIFWFFTFSFCASCVTDYGIWTRTHLRPSSQLFPSVWTFMLRVQVGGVFCHVILLQFLYSTMSMMHGNVKSWDVYSLCMHCYLHVENSEIFDFLDAAQGFCRPQPVLERVITINMTYLCSVMNVEPCSDLKPTAKSIFRRSSPLRLSRTFTSGVSIDFSSSLYMVKNPKSISTYF